MYHLWSDHQLIGGAAADQGLRQYGEDLGLTQQASLSSDEPPRKPPSLEEIRRSTKVLQEMQRRAMDGRDVLPGDMEEFLLTTGEIEQGKPGDTPAAELGDDSVKPQDDSGYDDLANFREKLVGGEDPRIAAAIIGGDDDCDCANQVGDDEFPRHPGLAE